MLWFIARRVVYMLMVIIAISAVIFGLSRVAGDPRYLYLTEYSTPSSADWDAMGRELHLDKPVVVQYLLWLGRAARGDFGKSLRDQVNSLDLIKRGAGATAQLAGVSFLLMVVLGVPLGVLSAVKRGGVWDYAGRTFALIGQAAPPFWLGIVLVMVFAVKLHWLPTFGRGDWKHLVLPAVTLAWPSSAGLLRLTRSSMLEVLDSQYVTFARAKGVGSWVIIWKHALKNAIIAPLTYMAIILASFVVGAVVVETVFAWPGLGRLTVQAALNNDFPLITGLAMVFAAAFTTANFLADIAYALVDPRIRYS